MYLRSFSIKNFLSLEDVVIDGLDQFNTFIGRNNAGKSAVFKVLRHLGRMINGQDLERFSVPNGNAALTDRDTDRSLELRLRFETNAAERNGFMEQLPNTREGTERRKVVQASRFMNNVEFTFRSAKKTPWIIHLRQTGIEAQDGNWAIVQQMNETDDEKATVPLSRVTSFCRVDQDSRLKFLYSGKINIDQTDINALPPMDSVGIGFDQYRTAKGEPFLWLLSLLSKWFAGSFYFSPFRHCQPQVAALENQLLEQDGSNLAQVLANILASDRPLFSTIEAFVHAAVPGLGVLQTPISGRDNLVGFRSDTGYFTHLHEMGGGVEQLLMVALVLLTTPSTSTLFLEEPESHLHPGALRFLLEKLATGDRQVFITSHSPVLLNAVRDQKVFRVTNNERRSFVAPVGSDTLGELLAEIGARNSDVLLSDAVLFVEGPSDEATIGAWGVVLGQPLEEHNVTVLQMEGGQYAEQKGPPRAEVLEGISNASPVPHLFLFDRDEREEVELDRLANRLKGRCHVLMRRELENYLLAPRALLEVLRLKAGTSSDPVRQRIATTTPNEIAELTRTIADNKFGTILLRRIRARVPGLRGGLLERSAAESLVPHALDSNLSSTIRGLLEARMKNHLDDVDFDAIVRAEKEELEQQWKDHANRLNLVPGEEILLEVFGNFDLAYAKSKDAARIAGAMLPEEIHAEIVSLLQAVIELPAQLSPHKAKAVSQ